MNNSSVTNLSTLDTCDTIKALYIYCYVYRVDLNEKEYPCLIQLMHEIKRVFGDPVKYIEENTLYDVLRSLGKDTNYLYLYLFKSITKYANIKDNMYEKFESYIVTSHLYNDNLRIFIGDFKSFKEEFRLHCETHNYTYNEDLLNNSIKDTIDGGCGIVMDYLLCKGSIDIFKEGSKYT